MKFGLSTDTSGETRVYEVANELVSVFPALESNLHLISLEVFFVFRCLPDKLGRKSSRRFSKAESVLFLDMCFSEDLLKDMDVEQQRSVVAKYFFNYVEDSLGKYKFEGLDVASFMFALKREAASIGWID
ncbi:hypothetical protein [Stenotrophomonas sp. ESTM1D_MKCIP4_1]|uniref:hypothetical protein n=1 Tax=Stenotrophomonas sp. ESTM1D_MKCIP4_1 TaxID=2072414 RepID=UPI00131F0172|nr:hypothetical protein [Stenotrophomonas sp. ESTM1D_MKCIP4_1]